MKIKFAKDAYGIKFYPITIAAGVIDNDRNQRLNVTLADIYSKIPSQSYATEAECEAAASELT